MLAFKFCAQIFRLHQKMAIGRKMRWLVIDMALGFSHPQMVPPHARPDWPKCSNKHPTRFKNAMNFLQRFFYSTNMFKNCIRHSQIKAVIGKIGVPYITQAKGRVGRVDRRVADDVDPDHFANQGCQRLQHSAARIRTNLKNIRLCRVRAVLKEIFRDGVIVFHVFHSLELLPFHLHRTEQTIFPIWTSAVSNRKCMSGF